MIPPIHSRTDVLFNNADLEDALSSSVSNIRECVGYSIQIVWEGGTSTAGEFILEGTNDYTDDNEHTFTTISTNPVSENSGNILINVERAMYAAVRVSWVPSAGTGGSYRAKLVVKLA